MPIKLTLNVLAITAISFMSAASALAGTPPISFADVPTIRLWPDDAAATQPADKPDVGEMFAFRGPTSQPLFNVNHITHPWLAAVGPKTSNAPRAAVIICPGGGYATESMTNEGFEVAERFNQDGVMAFVLKYRLPHGVPPAADTLPVPQQDVLRSIQLVRARAAEWNIDPQRIGIVGFSAGGHLAATALTMYDEAKEIPMSDDISKVSAKPDFGVLVYAVISMEPNVGHTGSRTNLIGKDADETLSKRFSTDQHVTSDTPPMFITQAKDDKTVPYHNAELINAAAEKARVVHELVPIEKGGHGFGLGKTAETQVWYPKCIEWLRAQHFVEAAK